LGTTRGTTKWDGGSIKLFSKSIENKKAEQHHPPRKQEALGSTYTTAAAAKDVPSYAQAIKNR
jgi:hypothetical protein